MPLKAFDSPILSAMVTARTTEQGLVLIVMLMCPDGGIGRRAGFRCQ